MVLVKHLPRDSALQRHLHGEAAEWSVTDHLLAATVDHLAVANWMFTCVNSGEDSDPPEFPKPVPRPGAKDDEDEGADEGAGADGPAEAETTARTGEAQAPPALSPGQLARFFG
ncbi:hypothetical protein ACFQ8C_19395 [Streptomyces sp. NPDC056503]|uniref:hypothetical protein n=1 Tax=Streptomyces sp. NPDC056503 TaxID=3345842 RepID=UPI00369F0F89